MIASNQRKASIQSSKAHSSNSSRRSGEPNSNRKEPLMKRFANLNISDNAPAPQQNETSAADDISQVLSSLEITRQQSEMRKKTKVVCIECKGTFKKLLQLMNHLEKEHNYVIPNQNNCNFICQACIKSFQNQDKYDSHLYSKHRAIFFPERVPE